MSLQEDPVNKAIKNAIYGGIKRGIQVTMENECWGSALILIYSGIDAMAFLNMPSHQQEVTSADFKNWILQYLKQASGNSYPAEDMYGTRCALLHQYGAESRLSRTNKIRIIDHVDKGPDVLVDPVDQKGHLWKDHIWLNFHSLAKNFYAAIDNFLIDVFANGSKRALVETRLSNLLQAFPFRNG